MNKIKILLAGTPNFSVSTFTKIIENFDVVAIISQPNKPVGREKIVMDTPTSMLAKFHKIKIFQPEKISTIYEELKKIEFDILITMAYGQIIPENILKLAKIGSYNIHASLLPKYRGASPIQYALLNGDKETGITFMEMTKEMDAGDIIFQQEIKINDDDVYDDLLKKMSFVSSEKIVEWIQKIKSGDFEKIKQDESKISYSPKISKDDEKIVFDTIERTTNKIRSLSSVPGAYMICQSEQQEYKNIFNKRVKIFKVSKTYIKNSLEIKCSDGFIYATDFQFEGKRRVKIN